MFCFFSFELLEKKKQGDRKRKQKKRNENEKRRKKGRKDKKYVPKDKGNFLTNQQQQLESSFLEQLFFDKVVNKQQLDVLIVQI